eukprot:7081998-Prymnesium_polylepis.1
MGRPYLARLDVEVALRVIEPPLRKRRLPLLRLVALEFLLLLEYGRVVCSRGRAIMPKLAAGRNARPRDGLGGSHGWQPGVPLLARERLA